MAVELLLAFVEAVTLFNFTVTNAVARETILLLETLAVIELIMICVTIFDGDAVALLAILAVGDFIITLVVAVDGKAIRLCETFAVTDFDKTVIVSKDGEAMITTFPPPKFVAPGEVVVNSVNSPIFKPFTV